jgi:hypothetical protein
VYVLRVKSRWAHERFATTRMLQRKGRKTQREIFRQKPCKWYFDLVESYAPNILTVISSAPLSQACAHPCDTKRIASPSYRDCRRASRRPGRVSRSDAHGQPSHHLSVVQIDHIVQRLSRLHLRLPKLLRSIRKCCRGVLYATGPNRHPDISDCHPQKLTRRGLFPGFGNTSIREKRAGQCRYRRVTALGLPFASMVSACSWFLFMTNSFDWAVSKEYV